MKKTYFVEEICSKTYELEGTELEIQDEIERIMSDSKEVEREPDYYEYTAKEIGFDDEVQDYLDSFTPRYTKEDLEQVLRNAGIPPTEKNLRKFMELNPQMSGVMGFMECLIDDWYCRMDALVMTANKSDYEIAVKKWKMDDMIVEIRIGDDYLGEELDRFSEAYEVYVDGDMKWNYLTLGNAKDLCSAIALGRKVEVLA